MPPFAYGGVASFSVLMVRKFFPWVSALEVLLSTRPRRLFFFIWRGASSDVRIRSSTGYRILIGVNTN